MAGCATVYLDGSYVTGKPLPGDFDACWNPEGVDIAKLDPVLKDFSHARRAQKQKYFGEFFPSIVLADGKNSFLDFFQTEKDTGLQKGIIAISLLGERRQSDDHQRETVQNHPQ